MAKQNIIKAKKNVRKDIEKIEISNDIKRLAIIAVVVLLFLAIFYLMTVIILDDGTKSNKDDEGSVEVQHDEILVGTSFSIKDGDYYVLYYETEDEEVNSDIYSLISKYRSSDTELYLYTVDMSNALNSSFNADSGNSSATKASELMISGPTLIKFSHGVISQYVEGIDNIKGILE